MRLSLVRVRRAARGGLGGGDHHVAGSRQPRPAVGNSAERDGVRGLGRPHKAEAHVRDGDDEAASATRAQPVLRGRAVHRRPQ